MRVTISDVAKKAGVSKTTVSRILNQNFAHTTEETRQRVLDVIRELDYHPNALAKGLKSPYTSVIGMVLSNIRNPYWASVLEGVEDTARELGFNLMISNSNEEPEKEIQYIREFQRRQVDGIVINPTVHDPEFYRDLIESEYPLVVVNRKIRNVDINEVTINNIRGATLAVQHLLDNGRRSIAAIVYRDDFVSTWQERIQGYQETLLRNGYLPEDFRVIWVDRKSSVKNAMIEYMSANPGTDAIFSTNNMITLEVLEAMRELDVRIPEQVALVGYDETVWSKHLDPPLTIIKQPGYEMGKIAAQILIRAVKSKGESAIQRIVLEPEIVIRKSSAPPGSSMPV